MRKNHKKVNLKFENVYIGKVELENNHNNLIMMAFMQQNNYPIFNHSEKTQNRISSETMVNNEMDVKLDYTWDISYFRRFYSRNN